MIISFSGLDGSGKTTHIKTTVAFLRKRGVETKVIEVYNISIFSIMGRLLSGLSKKVAQGLVEEQFSIDKEASLKKRFLSLIRRICIILDVLFFYLFVRLPAKIRKRWVICDRYFYDAVIQLYYLGMCSKEFYERSLKWIPVPDISILILVEPNVAFERKFEYDTNYFNQKSLFYEDVAMRKINCEVVVSNAFRETQKEIEQIITTKMDRIERRG
jgi:thymidylate kinase